MSNPKGKKYLMSPYLFSLTCFFWILLLFVNGMMLKFCIEATQGMTFGETVRTGIFQGVLFIAALTLILLRIFFHNGYEYFGTIEICSDRLVFRTLLRRPRVFCYSELKDIGIDYGLLQFDHKQFWIYVSKVPLDRKYLHNILRLPYSADTMRVQYRRELYDALLDAMPNDRIGKQLYRSHSVIKLHRVEES